MKNKVSCRGVLANGLTPYSASVAQMDHTNEKVPINILPSKHFIELFDFRNVNENQSVCHNYNYY